MTRERGVPNRRIQRASSKQRAPQRGTSSREENPSRQVAVKPKPPEPPKKPEGRLDQVGDAIANFSQGLHKSFFTDWRVPVALSLALTGGVAALSIGFLLKLPAVPNCPSIFWPLASASLRMHCAQLAAGKRTVNDLLEAIRLLNTLPPDNPLYEEAARLIEEWSKDILDLGEESFQAGKLKDAIDMAKKVPDKSRARAEVEATIKRWEEIWGKAEDLYKRAEDFLRKEDWRNASLEAGRLLSVDNRFWQTTKYQEMTDKVAMTRDDINKLAKAKDLVAQGGVKNLLEALKVAAEINDKSYVHQRAQEFLAKTGNEMFKLAEDLLGRRDLTGALDLVRQIPPQANLQKEVEDFEKLANAESRTWSGNEADIEAAIADAQRIAQGRPLYEKAQKLIARFSLAKEDGEKLNRARQMAQSTNPAELQNAIALAAQISGSSPRAKEAQEFVAQLTSDLQTKQDRPILDQAEQIASGGDAASLQRAIDEISKVGSGRALSDQAREKRQGWARRLEEIRKNEAELAKASQPSSPTFTGDNPSGLNPSQNSGASAEQMLESAKQTASAGTIDSYGDAIMIANQIPSSSPVRQQADQYVEQLASQMLQAARNQSAYDTQGAIESAQKIPPGSQAYSQAQLQIQAWRKSLGL
jgi:hypothetical protein